MASRALAGDDTAGEVLLRVIETTTSPGDLGYTPSLRMLVNTAEKTEDIVVFTNIMTKFEKDVKKVLNPEKQLAESHINPFLYKQLHHNLTRAAKAFDGALTATGQFFTHPGADAEENALVAELRRLGF